MVILAAYSSNDISNWIFKNYGEWEQDSDDGDDDNDDEN